MLMKSEDRWHCTNPGCAAERLVEREATNAGKNPRCACGSAMKKRYASPVLTYLEFLRLEEEPKVAAHEN